MKYSTLFGCCIFLFSSATIQAKPTSCLIDPTNAIQQVDDSVFSGVNGEVCKGSPYNCKLRPVGGNQVFRANNPQSRNWRVDTGRSIRDGNGNSMKIQQTSLMRFNFGQRRYLAGKHHVFAVSSDNSSAGWYPLNEIQEADEFYYQSFSSGKITAKNPSQGKMACYQIKSSVNSELIDKKVVYDAQTKWERAGDYLPLVRKNGKPSANLIFNVPGCALGGVAIDHFPSGSVFQRLYVPTVTNRPSLDIQLWSAASDGRYTQKSGDMKFIYGYVFSGKEGRRKTKRYGWMAYDSLKRTSQETCDSLL